MDKVLMLKDIQYPMDFFIKEQFGFACNIVKLNEDSANSFTFTPKSFVFNTVLFDSAKNTFFR